MKKHDLLATVIVPEDQTLKLPEDQTLLLFQSVRELLINASKHAGTGQAMVEMAEKAGRLQITVRDEGVGFDLAAAAAAAAAGTTSSGGVSSKFGLFSIRERMKAIGGWFDIQSSPGKGTCATLALPLPTLSEFRREAQLEIFVPYDSRLPDAKSSLLIDDIMIGSGSTTPTD
jgi:signal transduction histidine kinase